MTTHPDHIEGWAFDPNRDELRDAVKARFEELKTQYPGIVEKIRTGQNPQRGRTKYSGTIPEGVELSKRDIAIICDEGNICFGGFVTIRGRRFDCEIYTD